MDKSNNNNPDNIDKAGQNKMGSCEEYAKEEQEQVEEEEGVGEGEERSEEEGEEEEEEEEEIDSIEEMMPQLLPVEGDLSSIVNEEPLTANEYLLRVRLEAQKFKDHHFVASIKSELIEKERKNEYIPNSFLLSYFEGNKLKDKPILADIDKETRAFIIKDFEELQHSVGYIRKNGQDKIDFVPEINPYNLAFDVASLRKKSGWIAVVKPKDKSKRIEPLLSIITRIDIETAEQILDWMCDDLVDVESNLNIYNTHKTKWLYSIMSLFEKPLISETSAMLSEILAGLIKMIHIVEEKRNNDKNTMNNDKNTMNDDENDNDDDERILAGYKACIIVIMDYFEQKYSKMF